MTLEKLGKEIQKLRKEQEYSQAELEEYSGVTKRTISKMENGFIDEIGIKKVESVLDILGVEFSLRPKGHPPTLEELQNEH
ncbi:MAG: helix-turn-helix transcriptional regulator [Campylobacterota bacterium]|nr:helix-turn-helix transcriptional regulator [Campylobacterota bacterium]